MAGPAAILRELHRLRRHAKDLQTEIDRGPRTLKAQQAKVTRQEEILQEARETVKRSKMATHERELSLKAKEQVIAKHEKQRNESTSKKEYDALQAEITNEKKTCRKLEDEILESMGVTEDLNLRLPEFEKAVQKTKAEVVQAIEDIQSRKNSLVESLNEVHRNLAEVEASLPVAIKALYEREVLNRGEDALAVVQNRTCAACYTEITAQSYNELLGEQYVACKNCGRILYLAERAAAMEEPPTD